MFNEKPLVRVVQLTGKSGEVEIYQSENTGDSDNCCCESNLNYAGN